MDVSLAPDALDRLQIVLEDSRAMGRPGGAARAGALFLCRCLARAFAATPATLAFGWTRPHGTWTTSTAVWEGVRSYNDGRTETFIVEAGDLRQPSRWSAHAVTGLPDQARQEARLSRLNEAEMGMALVLLTCAGPTDPTPLAPRVSQEHLAAAIQNIVPATVLAQWQAAELDGKLPQGAPARRAPRF